jgi:hypothetical protein
MATQSSGAALIIRQGMQILFGRAIDESPDILGNF